MDRTLWFIECSSIKYAKIKTIEWKNMYIKHKENICDVLLKYIILSVRKTTTVRHVPCALTPHSGSATAWYTRSLLGSSWYDDTQNTLRNTEIVTDMLTQTLFTCVYSSSCNVEPAFLCMFLLFMKLILNNVFFVFIGEWEIILMWLFSGYVTI